VKAAARALLDGLIDYAGLFPPAGLSMPEAVRNFAAYQRRPDAWALGRFVVTVNRLGEFEEALARLSAGERLGVRWPITALLGPEPREELALVDDFNSRYLHAGPEVRSLETRAGSPEEVVALRAAVPAGYELYLEVPLGASTPLLLGALHRSGARAKIRTGGTHESDIPAPETVLTFLRAAADQRVPFKATAGLHHPVRGPAPLTYQSGSPHATMLGYLNVFLAATLLWHGRAPEEARSVLTADSRATLTLGDDAIRWEGVVVEEQEIVRARREFALAIGSCSFTEPVEEIEAA
jgi:hypothetical protein